MPPKKTLWPLEPHTAVKHVILRSYLGAWLPMLAKWHGRIVYIDGFAGPGRYEGGQEGSPVIALNAVLDHPHFQKPTGKEVVFFFIEEDLRRAEFLKKEIAHLLKERGAPSWISHVVAEGKFALVMTEILDGLDQDKSRLAPTFAFIDPFGFSGAPLNVIARIANYPRCEVLISFMFESLNRFLDHPNPKIAQHMDELFGTHRWREILEVRDPEDRKNRLLSLYQQQLADVARLSHVRSFEMIDHGNRTEYFLVFGTNHKDGLSRMKEAIWEADPIQGQGFSDRTATGQITLLEPSPDLTRLREALQSRFRGQGWVNIDDVEDFVLVDTPYCERRQLKRATLTPMEREDLIEVLRPSDKGRKGTFPPGTMIRFR